LLLQEEETESVKESLKVELERQQKSLAARINVRFRQTGQLTANPPTVAEMQGVTVCVDDDLALPSAWGHSVAGHQAMVVDRRGMHTANFFIVRNPWSPVNPLITWAAVLLGAWVTTEGVFAGRDSGPSLKYNAAIMSRRFLWVSTDMQAQWPALWLLILEVLSHVRRNRWTVLETAEAFVIQKARAMATNQSAQVIGMVTASEKQCNAAGVSHVYTAEEFIAFITNDDAARTTLGFGGS